MKKIVGMLLVIAMSVSAFAIVEGSDVMYIGGTVSALNAGVIGHLDTTSQASLTFDSSGRKLVIPYDRIQSFQYSRQVARHYGALLTVAVVMVKFRQRRHFVEIRYLDEGNTPQVAVFEISKEMPRTLMAVLSTRAPRGCKPESFGHENDLGKCQAPAKVQTASR
jgi:hypothetical protein